MKKEKYKTGSTNNTIYGKMHELFLEMKEMSKEMHEMYDEVVEIYNKATRLLEPCKQTPSLILPLVQGGDVRRTEGVCSEMNAFGAITQGVTRLLSVYNKKWLIALLLLPSLWQGVGDELLFPSYFKLRSRCKYHFRHGYQQRK
ncbi:MAG: hypothetical protein HY063_15305 [Bacteroidetes bacterium]|nr:hypothetical protein [Bacteroidota bacterium]